MPDPLLVLPVGGMPEVQVGDDLAAVIAAGLRAAGVALASGDVVVVSSKVASKALGLRAPGRDAAVVSETVRVVAERASDGRLTRVVEAAAGPVMAAAGVDASNTGTSSDVLLLPRDPDAVCVDLRTGLRAAFGVDRLAVVLSDTAGRPWRAGQVDFALGSAGLQVLDDLRGSVDADGRALVVTARAVADEVAAAADLVKGKASGVPVAVVRGLEDWVGDRPGRAADLVRTGPSDWFAYGHREAVRAALGVEPGTSAAVSVGLADVAPEQVSTRLGRAVAVALWGIADDDATTGVDVGPAGPDAYRLVVTGADPVEVGRVTARLEVALWGESLRATLHREPGRTDRVELTVTGAGPA